MPAALVLAAALVWGVVRNAQIGFPAVPSATTLVAGAVIGALLAWLVGWLIVRVPLVATIIVAALILAFAAPGWLSRHALATTAFDRDVSTFLADQPDYGDGDAPVAAAPNLAGPLAGDRLTHPLSLLPGQRDLRSGARGRPPRLRRPARGDVGAAARRCGVPDAGPDPPLPAGADLRQGRGRGPRAALSRSRNCRPWPPPAVPA